MFPKDGVLLIRHETVEIKEKLTERQGTLLGGTVNSSTSLRGFKLLRPSRGPDSKSWPEGCRLGVLISNRQLTLVIIVGYFYDTY